MGLGRFLIAATLGMAFVRPAFGADRPPQYVIISFDGSRSVQMWKETRQLARDTKSGFTVFMSGIHFVTASTLKRIYQPPQHARGSSMISNIPDDKKDSILERIEQVELADRDGIDMGSHAIGHFDGGKWSLDEWTSELSQFAGIMTNVFMLNGLTQIRPKEEQQNWCRLLGRHLKGFRAPYLASNHFSDQALHSMGYTYDASRVETMDTWPFMTDGGVWALPMALIPVVGTAKLVTAMDYNFFLSDTRGENHPANAAVYEKRWISSLRNYFEHNYYGNRAPVNIGAHFDDWNGRAYFNGLFKFAREVCVKPEVRCVTGQEMVTILEKMGREQIARYRSGHFEKLQHPTLMRKAEVLDLNLTWEKTAEGLKLTAAGKDASRLKSMDVEVRLGDRIVSRELGVLPQSAIQASADGLSKLSVLVKRASLEVLSSTRRIRIKDGALQAVEKQDIEARARLGDLPEAHGLERDDDEPRFWDI